MLPRGSHETEKRAARGAAARNQAGAAWPYDNARPSALMTEGRVHGAAANVRGDLEWQSTRSSRRLGPRRQAVRGLGRRVAAPHLCRAQPAAGVERRIHGSRDTRRDRGGRRSPCPRETKRIFSWPCHPQRIVPPQDATKTATNGNL